MATTNSNTLIEDSIAKLDQFNSPLSIAKKAFSSFAVVLLIGGGIFVNWILAVIFLIGSFSSASFIFLGLGLLLLFVLFPLGYFFFAVMYGRGLIFWEAYQEVVKPLAAKIVGSSFDKFLPDNTNTENQQQEIEEKLLSKELEEQGQNMMDKLPTFISSKLEIISAIKNIVGLVRDERKRGVAKEEIKDKAMTSLFGALDTQLSGLVSAPSLLPVFGIIIVNAGVFMYLIS